MGNSQAQPEWIYAVPETEDTPKNETRVFRHPQSKGKDLWEAYGNRTVTDLYKERFQKRPEAVGFMCRSFDAEMGPEGGELRKVTNREFQELAEAFGSGLLNMDLVHEVNEWNNLALKFVGIYAKNSLKYLAYDVACTFYGLTAVPVYDTLGEEATVFAFEQTGMEVCVTTVSHLDGILKLKQKTGFGRLKTLVIMDPQNMNDGLWNAFKDSGIRLVRWEEVLEAGRKNVRPWAEVSPKSIAAFSYTSGTTGQPKGAMLSHENLASMCLTLAEVVHPTEQDVYLSYLPMAHVMEKSIVTACLYANIQVCFSCGDTNKLKDDLTTFRPTIFVSVPRLYNKFHEAIQKEVDKQGFAARFLFNRAVNSKKRGLHHNASLNSSFYDSLVFDKLKGLTGGRVRLMVSGSAPISVDVLETLKVSLKVPLIEGYGQTEGTAVEFVTRPDDPEAGHVGGPGLCNEFKLVDLPDMKYTSADKDDKGRPTPRGEILVRGPNVIPGYYKLDDKNRETFTEDGWMRSGDIGMLYSDLNRLKIVDRKKNMLKLSQGEYIAPEKLEGVFKEAHPDFEAVFVHGDSLKSSLIAVVNIEAKPLEKLAREAGCKETATEKMVQSPETKKKVLELLAAAGKAKGFNPMELPKDVLIETKPFQELGLISESFKVKRQEAQERYKKQFEEMYAKLQ